MMPKLFPLVLALTGLCATLAPARSARPLPHPETVPITAADTVPAATPRPRTIFERMFGGRPKSTPAPVSVTPAPTPKSTKPRKPKNASKPSEPTPAPEPVKAASTKKPGRTKPAASPDRPTAPEPATDADLESREKSLFDKTKSRAMEDPQVKELRKAVDEANDDVVSRKALRTYNHALFEKMRELDGSLKERIDRMESAIMKRLEE